MNAAKIREMFEQEETYWWFVARREMVLKILRRYVPRRSALLDAGCGTGLLTKSVDTKYDVTAIDIDPVSVKLTKSRKPKASVFQANIEESIPSKKQFDAVTLLDVLEHVDDKKALKNLNKAMKTGGILICTVPAYPWLFSYWDVLHQHKRRYTIPGLMKVARRYGFEPVHTSHFNTMMFPFMLVLRLFKSFIKPEKRHSDCADVPRIANGTLLRILRRETNLAIDHTIPFGLSILLIAKKARDYR